MFLICGKLTLKTTITTRKHRRKEGFALTPSVKLESTMKRSHYEKIMSQEKAINAGGSAHFQPGIPTHGMVQLTFRMVLFSLAKAFWKPLQRNTQKNIAMVSLSALKLAVKVTHHK